MPLIEMTVVQPEERKECDRKNAKRQGRVFRAYLRTYIAVSPPAERYNSKRTVRPCYLAFIGTKAQARAVTANLQWGQKAQVPGQVQRSITEIEILRSGGYRWNRVTTRDGTAQVVVAYDPRLFDLDPGMLDDAGMEFIFAPPSWWVAHEAEKPGVTREAALATRFAAQLDKRTPFPILNEPAFHLQLYRAALEEPWCVGAEDDRLEVYPAEAPGIATVLYLNVDGSTFESWLREQMNEAQENGLLRRHGG